MPYVAITHPSPPRPLHSSKGWTEGGGGGGGREDDGGRGVVVPPIQSRDFVIQQDDHNARRCWPALLHQPGGSWVPRKTHEMVFEKKGSKKGGEGGCHSGMCAVS